MVNSRWQTIISHLERAENERLRPVFTLCVCAALTTGNAPNSKQTVTLPNAPSSFRNCAGSGFSRQMENNLFRLTHPAKVVDAYHSPVDISVYAQATSVYVSCSHDRLRKHFPVRQQVGKSHCRVSSGRGVASRCKEMRYFLASALRGFQAALDARQRWRARRRCCPIGRMSYSPRSRRSSSSSSVRRASAVSARA